MLRDIYSDEPVRFCKQVPSRIHIIMMLQNRKESIGLAAFGSSAAEGSISNSGTYVTYLTLGW
jgi:hypothetical protein